MSEKAKLDKNKDGAFIINKHGIAVCAACKREKRGPGFLHDCDEKQEEKNRKAYLDEVWDE